jgi:hypothetical protein
MDLDAKIKEIIGSSSDNFWSAITALKNCARLIEEGMGSPFCVRFEPGFNTSRGMQLYLKVISDQKINETILVAIVPDTGYPVTFKSSPHRADSFSEVAKCIADILEEPNYRLKIRTCHLLGR